LRENFLPYFTTPDNCRLYYTTLNFEPPRPPVVFLNGTSQTTLYWEPHANAFSEHFGVLRYDARAQGKSDIGTRKISAEIHTADLQNLLDHLNVQRWLFPDPMIRLSVARTPGNWQRIATGATRYFRRPVTVSPPKPLLCSSR
jgi:3-oxoadipate enol-lactonase